ncbi:MAG: WecB/TagA/CpsF family glycosyltransferase [Gudongella sp.]|nr:WecB/TagA/CpsF family glycosyltransferase [Gudongella sp.]
MNRVDIMGVRILNTTLSEIVENLQNDIESNNKSSVFTPNTEIVMIAQKNSELIDEINKGTYVIPDGIGLIYGAKMRGIKLQERVTGYDTSISLLKLADEKQLSLYLLGGQDGVAEEAAKRINQEYKGIRISGFHHGYFKGTHTGNDGTEEENAIIEDINKSNTDILFVGFGFPKQEKWINSHIDKLNVKVAIGNGGVIDVLAGRVKRAPDIFIKLGLEWFYRLVSSPSRIKRQIVLPLFLIRVLFNKDSIKKL